MTFNFLNNQLIISIPNKNAGKFRQRTGQGVGQGIGQGTRQGTGHLSSFERISRGAFYTPLRIVNTVHTLIESYKKHPRAIVFDSSAGTGAFIRSTDKLTYKAMEMDLFAGDFLKRQLSSKHLFFGNSVLNVHRKRYGIADSDFLIQIGNPPYNDVTSAYKNGQKGKIICDPDLFDRDLGISFLKSYNKLKANVVCVLHPLSYLIKPANFRRLRAFAQNYRLKKGALFSSALFYNVSRMGFPIVIALYERDPRGMKYDEIRNFKFSILDNSAKSFRLRDYFDVDSFIRKYPPRKTDIQFSDIGIYYYTFRDINSLIRNRGFHTEKAKLSIVVHLKDFYKYAWLSAFKKLFRPKDLWMYGNLSPIGRPDLITGQKKLFVEYALAAEKHLFQKLPDRTVNQILKCYSLKKNKLRSEAWMRPKISALIREQLI